MKPLASSSARDRTVKGLQLKLFREISKLIESAHTQRIRPNHRKQEKILVFRIIFARRVQDSILMRLTTGFRISKYLQATFISFFRFIKGQMFSAVHVNQRTGQFK